jgi:hypothetical protein
LGFPSIFVSGLKLQAGFPVAIGEVISIAPFQHRHIVLALTALFVESVGDLVGTK